MIKTWGLTLCGVFISVAATAKPSVERLRIHDYVVNLVDVKTANDFGFTFAVPYGSADDEPPKFGLAHFLEHVLYSDPDHPFHEAFRKLGYELDATTGLDSTVHAAFGADDHGLAAMRLFFASFRRLNLVPTIIAGEKGTVINEVIKSAPNRPEFASVELPFAVLPEVGHPLRGHYYGDQQSLDGLGVDDLRERHQSIFHSGNVEIAVVGNLSTGRISRDEVVATLTELLPEREAAPAFRPRVASPIFAHDQQMDIESEAVREGRIFLPVRADADFKEVRAFLAAFVNRYAGGATEVAAHEMDWATGISAQLQRVGNQTFLILAYELTEHGYAHREEFTGWILRSLRAAQETLYPEALFADMRDGALTGLLRMEQSVPSLVSAFGHWMTNPSYQAPLGLDWSAFLTQFTPEAARNGARQLRFENMAVVFTGPDTSNNHFVDAHTHLKYGVKAWSSPAANIPAADPARVRVAKVPLIASTPSVLETVREEHRWLGRVEVIRSYAPEWTDRTVGLRFDFPGLSAMDELSLAAWTYQANEELQPELTALRADGVTVTISAGSRGLTLAATGTTWKEFAALEWLIERVGTLKPNARVLEQFRTAQQMHMNGAEDNFAGFVALGVMGELTSIFDQSRLGAARLLSRLNPEAMQALHHPFLTSRKTLVIAGATHAGEVEHLLVRAAQFSPNDAPNGAATVRPRVRKDVEHHEGWNRAEKDGVGVAQVFEGPPSRDRISSSALGIITTLMHDQVFEKLRPLGYVQSVDSRVSSPEQTQIIFNGQSDSPESLRLIRRAWANERERWSTRDVPSSEIEAGRQGVLAKLSRDPTLSAAAANQMLMSLDGTNEPFRRKRSYEVAKALGEKDFRATVDQFLGPRAPNLTVIKGLGPTMTCEELLNLRNATRAELLRTPGVVERVELRLRGWLPRRAH